MLGKPLLKQAFVQALTLVWERLPDASTVEGAALCHKTAEGAQDVLKALYELAEIKKVFVPTARPRFRTENPIV